MTQPCRPRIACSDPQLASALRHLFGEREVLEVPHDCCQPPCLGLRPAGLDEAVRVRAALYDAVAILERSRHAFRSRELGQLRRRLEQLLGELSTSAE